MGHQNTVLNVVQICYLLFVPAFANSYPIKFKNVPILGEIVFTSVQTACSQIVYYNSMSHGVYSV